MPDSFFWVIIDGSRLTVGDEIGFGMAILIGSGLTGGEFFIGSGAIGLVGAGFATIVGTGTITIGVAVGVDSTIGSFGELSTRSIGC